MLTDGDRQTDMTKIRVAFRNFVKVPKNKLGFFNTGLPAIRAEKSANPIHTLSGHMKPVHLLPSHFLTSILIVYILALIYLASGTFPIRVRFHNKTSHELPCFPMISRVAFISSSSG